MITHTIYVSKPEAAKVVHAGPRDYHGDVIVPSNKLHCSSQAELDAALALIGCPVGTFVAYEGANVHSLACIHVIVDVERDYDKVDKRFGNKTVNPYRVVQCDKWSPSAHEWVRWDDLVHLRPLTKKEWTTYVEKEIDNIQDRCQRYFPENFTLSRTYPGQ